MAMTDEEREQKEQEIINIKSELTAGDYKIIKSYEYSLTGKDLPYDMQEINRERETKRSRINALQAELSAD